MTGRDQDVVVSTRIRLARNIKDYPFDPRLNRASAEEIIARVEQALGSDYQKIDFTKISAEEAGAYAERHLVSAEFAEKRLPHALFEHKAKNMEIMACEEDHLRIQCIMAGLALDEAFSFACEADSTLDKALTFAYDEQLGYLTHCPTNLGTGMRASVMMFLPAITMTRRIGSLQNQLAKIGLTIRGAFGEGSAAAGCLYQISNQITLGITEEETIKKLGGVVESIMSQERTLRTSVKGEYAEKLEDKICRSLGTLMHARLMSSGEFTQLYADIRLGIATGAVEGVDYTTLDHLLISVLPNNLVVEAGEGAADGEVARDRTRAGIVRRTLAEASAR